MTSRHPDGPVPEALRTAQLAVSIRVKVGTVEQIAGPEIGRAVLEDDAAIGIQGLALMVRMSNAELGGWVHSLMEKAAEQARR